MWLVFLVAFELLAHGLACQLDEVPVFGGPRVLVRVTASDPSLARYPPACSARSFFLRLPTIAATNISVVLAIPGAFQTAVDFFESSPERPDLCIDCQLAAAGFVVVGVNAVVNISQSSSFGTCTAATPPSNASDAWSTVCWTDTVTSLDPVNPLEPPSLNEVSFFFDALQCVRDVLAPIVGLYSLSGNVLALGESQGGKLASRLGCSTPRPGFTVRGVFAVEGLFADAAQAPMCTNGHAPPPLLAFQATEDLVVPFCISGAAYAAGRGYWNAWTNFGQQCWHWPGRTTPPLPIMYAQCPGGRVPVPPYPHNTTLLGIYSPLGCSSSMALAWTSETRLSGGNHKWPGVMSAFGGLDGGGVAALFFRNLLSDPRASPFRGLTSNLSSSLACHALLSTPAGATCGA